MDFAQFLVNNHLVNIFANSPSIKKLNEDNVYLAKFLNAIAKTGQFDFLFVKDPNLGCVTVQRIPKCFKQVWCGRPSVYDVIATIMLVKLRNSERYTRRFADGRTCKYQLWQEIANEMRAAGFDVNVEKCARRIIQLFLKKKALEGNAGCVPNARRNPGEDQDGSANPGSISRKRRCTSDQRSLKKRANN